MTITLKIDNPDIEQQLKEFIKEQKELTLEAFNNLLTLFRNKKN